MKLGSVGTTFGGLTGKSKAHFGHGDARYVTFVEVMEGARLRGGPLGRVVTYKGEKQPEIRRGDVLFNTSSETPEEVALGAHVDFDVPPRVHLNSFCFGYRVTIPDTIDPRFLAYYFRSGQGRRMVASLAQGATRYNISKTKLLEVPIVLPSYQEQRAIAEDLTDCDDHIDALNRLIAKKRDVKQGMMQELLTGRTRLPGFSGDWGSVRMSDVGATYGGLFGKSKEDFGVGTALYVTFMEVLESPRLLGSRLDRVRIPKGERQNGVKRGDLIFNSSSETPEEVAMGTVVDFEPDGEVFLNSFCFGFRLRNSQHRVAPPYLALWFRSRAGREAVSVLAQGATRYNIAKTKVVDIEPVLPPRDEQKAIVAVLADADAEIEALERRLESARAVKVGMMQELLTGRTRLPVEEEA